MMQGQYW